MLNHHFPMVFLWFSAGSLAWKGPYRTALGFPSSAVGREVRTIAPFEAELLAVMVPVLSRDHRAA